MCGRYVSPDDAAIKREFNLVNADEVPVVRVNKEGDRTGSRMHWGLIPYWAKGIPPKFSTMMRPSRN